VNPAGVHWALAKSERGTPEYFHELWATYYLVRVYPCNIRNVFVHDFSRYIEGDYCVTSWNKKLTKLTSQNHDTSVFFNS
jgi:hypothetical protein